MSSFSRTARCSWFRNRFPAAVTSFLFFAEAMVTSSPIGSDLPAGAFFSFAAPGFLIAAALAAVAVSAFPVSLRRRPFPPSHEYYTISQVMPTVTYSKISNVFRDIWGQSHLSYQGHMGTVSFVTSLMGHKGTVPIVPSPKHCSPCPVPKTLLPLSRLTIQKTQSSAQ